MTRKTIDLSGMWRFQPDPHDDGERLGFMQPATDNRRWPRALVPGSFDSQNENCIFYEGKAWYRTMFPTLTCWCGKRVVITFHGANCRTKVWLNGTLLGENHDPFLPFSFPMDQHLAAKGANVLAVRVDNESYPEDLPGQYVGWRIFGGILREVTITAMSAPMYPMSWDVTITISVQGQYGMGGVSGAINLSKLSKGGGVMSLNGW